MLSLMGNMMNAFCVSVDRYIFMAYPLRYDVFVTRMRVLIATSGVWTLIGSVTIATVAITYVLGDNLMCYFHGLLSWGPFYCVILVQFVLFSALSFSFIGRYLFMSWKQGRQTGAWMGSVAVAGGENKEITNMMGVIITIHIICYTPCLVVGIFTTVHLTPALYDAESITTTILFINSWVKPFVYYWRNNNFRKGYRKTLKDISECKFRQIRTVSTSSVVHAHS